MLACALSSSLSLSRSSVIEAALADACTSGWYNHSLMAAPLILDIETKYTFRQFADPAKLGVSVVVAYDYADGQYHSYTEDRLSELFIKLEMASYVIGYNIAGFDLPVLQAYYHGDVSKLSVFDMLEDIRQTTGRRFGLNDVSSSTLGMKKSANGLQAIEWYKQGKIDEIIKYCTDDVKITRQVFEYGAIYGCVYVGVGDQRARIATSWDKYKSTRRPSVDVPSTLPF